MKILLPRRKFLAGLAAPAIIKADRALAQFNGCPTGFCAPVSTGGGGGGGTLILDQMSSVTPVAVFSTRKLLAAYAGNAMNVTSSGGGTSNIGFTGTDLNTTALASFVGSNTGTVNTWYDQSGNGNNATVYNPGTASPFPLIRLTGTNYTLGGTHVALNTSAPNTNAALVFSTAITTPSTVSIAWCFKFDTLGPSGGFTDGPSGNWRYLIGSDATSTQYNLYNFVSASSGGTLDTTTVHTAVATFDNAGTALGNLYIDNILTIGPIAINASSFLDGQTLFVSFTQAGCLGTYGEMLFFTGIMSSGDRAIYHSTATGSQSCQSYWGSA